MRKVLWIAALLLGVCLAGRLAGEATARAAATGVEDVTLTAGGEAAGGDGALYVLGYVGAPVLLALAVVLLVRRYFRRG